MEHEQEVHKNVIVQETKDVRRSNRIRHKHERYGFLLTQTGDIMLMDNDEPITYQDAMNSPEFERWLEAMKSEMDSMYENKVWTLVKPPEGVK